jgi:hypothetical protein
MGRPVVAHLFVQALIEPMVVVGGGEAGKVDQVSLKMAL